MRGLRLRLGFGADGGAAGPTTTWDPAFKGAQTTLSNSDRTATNATAFWNQTRSTTSKTDKRYFEMTVVSGANAAILVGNSSVPADGFILPTGNAAWWSSDGNVYYNGTSTGIGTYAPGDVLGCAVDPVGGTVKFNKNGGAFSTDIAIPLVGGTVFAMTSMNNGASTLDPLPAAAPPAGYAKWDS